MTSIRKPLMAAAGLAAAAIAAWLVLGHRQDEASKEKPVPQPSFASPGVLRFPPNAPQLAFIKTDPVQAVPLPASEPLNARLALDETLTSRVSVPVAGRVLRITHEIGEGVSRGDVLLTYDSPDFGTAQSDLRKARSDASNKRVALERAQRLFEGEAIARRDLEAARTDWEIAEAEAERARLRLRNLSPQGAASDHEDLSLRAQTAGVVVARNVTPGQEVRPDLDQPLFVISDLRRLWLLADLPVDLSTRVKSGDSLLVRVEALGDVTFKARVDRIAPSVDPVLRRVSVRAVIENTQGRLRPEMFARVALEDPEGRQGVRIPASAVVTEGLHLYAFVRSAKGEFIRRQLQPVYQDDQFVYVPAVDGGLAAGEVVVTSGAMLLNAELSAGL